MENKTQNLLTSPDVEVRGVFRSFVQPEVTSTSACLLGFIPPLEYFALPQILWPGKNNAIQTAGTDSCCKKEQGLFLNNEMLVGRWKEAIRRIKDVNSLLQGHSSSFSLDQPQTRIHWGKCAEELGWNLRAGRSNSETELCLLQRQERMDFVFQMHTTSSTLITCR